MPDRFVQTHIRRLPIFERVPPEMLPHLTEGFRVLRVEPGELVFRQGEPTQGMYLLVSGQGVLFKQEDGREIIIGTIEANQYVNDAALFTAGIEKASLRIIESANVLFLSRRRLTDILSHHAELTPYLPVPDDTIKQQIKKQIFKGQRPNEEVLMDTRRHRWAWIRRAWVPGTLMILMIMAAFLIPFSAFTLVIIVLALLIPGGLLLYYYLEWRNDHVIITDQRITHIEHDILTFRNRTSEVPIGSVQEVNADIITSDPFSRLFNYGNVHIKTAGDAGNMQLTVMPRPNDIQELIFANTRRQANLEEREHRNSIRATVDKVLGNATGEFPTVDGADGNDEESQPQATVRSSQRPFLRTRFVREDGSIVYRKHLAFWLRGTLWPGFLILSGLLFLVAAATLNAFEGLRVIGPAIGFFVMLVGFIWFYWSDWDWRNDVYILGDETIQIIHQRPLWLQNEDDQVLLERVDNIVSLQSGFLQTALSYGNVRLSLVGGAPEDAKVFRAVSRPQKVQAEIARRQSLVKQRAANAQEKQRREEIAEYLSVYHETVSQQQGKADNYTPKSTITNGSSTPGVNYQPELEEEPAPGQFYAGRPVRDRNRPPKVPRVRRY